MLQKNKSLKIMSYSDAILSATKKIVTNNDGTLILIFKNIFNRNNDNVNRENEEKYFIYSLFQLIEHLHSSVSNFLTNFNITLYIDIEIRNTTADVSNIFIFILII